MGKTIVARWYVKSLTHADLTYEVVKFDDDHYAWDCKGGAIESAGRTLDELILDFGTEDSLTKVALGGYSPPDWALGVIEKKQPEKQLCVCSMVDLWNGGCPSNRGLACKSQK